MRRALQAAQEEERDALSSVGEEEDLMAAQDWQPLDGSAAQHGSCLSVSSAPTRLGTRPRQGAAIATVTAVHADIGVRIAAPPRTESSIPVPMATNPVTRQLAFNAMSPQQVGSIRPIEPDGQVALHYIHLVIFVRRMHPTNRTLDDHVWNAALEEKWGVDLWPAHASRQF
eukprot:6211992-Pleurochrysis_carterae.AAC.2